MMKLALRLGRTVAELREQMSADEFRYWLAFDQLSPIGDERADILAATTAATPLQAQGAKISIYDMLPPWAKARTNINSAETKQQQIIAGENSLKAHLLSMMKKQPK